MEQFIFTKNCWLTWTICCPVFISSQNSIFSWKTIFIVVYKEQRIVCNELTIIKYGQILLLCDRTSQLKFAVYAGLHCIWEPKKKSSKIQHIQHIFFIYDVIWENVHKVGKFDFEIFIASHEGDNEEYSEKNYTKSSILHRGMAFQRSKLKIASFKKCFSFFFSTACRKWHTIHANTWYDNISGCMSRLPALATQQI